jgi:DNA-directed RNA polymerase specialized sigma24 family protein
MISLPGVVSEPSEQDDAQLVKASQHGNQDDFAFLVQRHQRRGEAREQMEKLPARYRSVLILRHLQEMTYEEMVGILTMPLARSRPLSFGPGIS